MITNTHQLLSVHALMFLPCKKNGNGRTLTFVCGAKREDRQVDTSLSSARNGKRESMRCGKGEEPVWGEKDRDQSLKAQEMLQL